MNVDTTIRTILSGLEKTADENYAAWRSQLYQLSTIWA